MFTTGKFQNEEMAQICLDYINRELTTPVPGVLVTDEGNYRLAFDGMANYAITRDKVENAVTDFTAGWTACATYLLVNPTKKAKKTKS